MATKDVETVTDLVEQVNAKQTGIKVAGQWLTVSQYHALAQLPWAPITPRASVTQLRNCTSCVDGYRPVVKESADSLNASKQRSVGERSTRPRRRKPPGSNAG